MERVIPATAFKAQALRLLERAAAGEAFVVTKHGRPIAKLVPLEHGGVPRSLLGCMHVVDSDDDLETHAEWEAAGDDWEPR